MRITYTVPNETMGDGMDVGDCDAYREWAKTEISTAFPDHEVDVHSDGFETLIWTDDDRNGCAIDLFILYLWGRCPWSEITKGQE